MSLTFAVHMLCHLLITQAVASNTNISAKTQTSALMKAYLCATIDSKANRTVHGCQRLQQGTEWFTQKVAKSQIVFVPVLVKTFALIVVVDTTLKNTNELHLLIGNTFR